MRYRIQFEPDDDGSLLVTCPDIPELVTFGEDDADARHRATDALVTVLQGRINTRQEIPLATMGDGVWITLPALPAAKVELYRTMQQLGVSKAELGRRLQAHGPSVDRLLDLHHDSRLSQIEAAFGSLGRSLRIVHEAA